MNDHDKTKEQLIRELRALRQRNAALEQARTGNIIEALGFPCAEVEHILHTIADGLVIVNPAGEITHANPAAEKILNLRRDDIVGRYYQDGDWQHIDGDGAPYPPEQLPLALALGEQKVVEGLEHGIIASDGEVKWLSVYAAPLVGKQGELYGAVANFTDITRQKQAEDALTLSQTRLRQTIDLVPSHILVRDIEGRYLVVNQAAAAARELTPEQMEGKRYDEVPDGLTQELPDFLSGDQQVITSQQHLYIPEQSYTLPGKAPRVFEVHKLPYPRPAGEAPAVLILDTDVTERKQAEADLRDALAEKEVLLQEVHHRVKNNLQTIHSLLYKQRQYIGERTARQALTESMDRVQAMALIHEHLYRSKRFASINLAEYIRHFARYVLQCYRPPDQDVSLTLALEEAAVSLDVAVPLALALNELLTNALKYAFPDNRSGEIAIECREQQGGAITLIVRDNGVGLPEQFDAQQTPTLGWYLVYNLVTKQLHGTVEIQRRDPTQVTLRFEKNRKD